MHHLNGYDWDIQGRTDVKNGITITKELHKAFHMKYGYGNNTREQFLEFVGNIDLILEIRELLKYIKKYRFVKIKSHIDTTMIDATYEEFKSINNIRFFHSPFLFIVCRAWH